MSAPKKSAAVRVPKGWRVLQEGTLLKRGDKYERVIRLGGPGWKTTSLFRKGEACGFAFGCRYIRKTRSAKARKGKA